MPGLAAQSERIALPLLEGFAPDTPYWLDGAAFAARFRRSPIRRAKRHGMLRNVCVALGNWGDPVVVEPLTRALHDPEPMVRGHAAWALGCILRRHGHEGAAHALTGALKPETNAWVAEEIHTALTSTNDQ
jgi:epoxyqueuosine reductase